MKRNLLVFSLLLFSANVFAQKLPDVQESALAAPTNIRIDGKSTEWNNTYAAENKRTDLFYSLANDDKNLYLIIKSANSAAANKIMLGGISFTINTEGKKRAEAGYTVTYPLVVRSRNLGGGNRQGQGRMGGFNRNRDEQTQQQRDSSILVQRKAALTTAKEIKISGFKKIADSVLSIYNEYSLKTVANFDQTGAFVYELAIPLNLLEISPGNAKEFAYQIKVNGASARNIPASAIGSISVVGNGAGGKSTVIRGIGGGNFQDLMSPTDFWGKYTLIKK